MSAGYSVETTADVALTAATAKTVLAAIAAANSPIKVVEFAVSFDGISGTAEPVTVELCLSTVATAGTNTAQTPLQLRGPTRTVQAAGARNYTAEGTVLTCVKRWLVHPQTGICIQFPLGREVDSTISGTTESVCLRVTAPATLNCQAYIEFEEGG